MNVDEALRQLGGGPDFPNAAMRWALDHWSEASPRLVARLRAFAQRGQRTDATADEAFFIVHLCGEMREARAYAPLCAEIAGDPAIAEWLGDAVTETLRGILINVFDGDVAPLQGAIEAADADEFARAAALEALGYLVRARGALSDETMRAYLRRLRREMKPREDSFIWSAWAATAANLGYDDFKPDVAALGVDGFIGEYDFDLDEFDRQARLAHADAAGLAGFEDDDVKPFDDAIGTLASWSATRADDATDEQDLAEIAHWDAPPGPFVNPLRGVGRNDLCPCGSGKKFKKCCMPA